jgi:hypothetical protein
MDEEHFIEVTHPEDGSGDMIITVSITRTYLFADLPLAVDENSIEEGTIGALNTCLL